jgi:hypothetical protein
VQRPQADGAVVRVAVARHGGAASCPRDDLAPPRQRPRQVAPRFVEPTEGAPGRSTSGIAVVGAKSGRRSRLPPVRP